MKINGEERGRRGEYSGPEEPDVSEKRYRTVIEQAPLAIHVLAPDGRSLLANNSWNELWHLGEKEHQQGTNIFEDRQLQATGLIPYVEKGVAGESVTPPPLLYDPARNEREGDPCWLQPFIYPVKDEEGRVREVTLIIEDVTKRKALEEELSYRALHDPLSGLPNRALFVDRLEHALAHVERRGGKVAVLFLNLDNFKYVNDSLGRKVGDQLLCEVADRLKNCIRPDDTVARFGGDEFATLLEDVASLDEATEVAERLALELRAPFILESEEVFLTTSIGIVLGGAGEAGGDGAEDLLRNAGIALHRGKEGGKDRHEVYKTGMQTRVSEQLGLEGDLRRAVGSGREFVVHYQPKIGLSTGRVVGLEALVRWAHPTHGLVNPLEFVPLAEETGLIVPIGKQVLEEACQQAHILLQEQYSGGPEEPPLTMCVNLSVRQFRNPRLVAEVARTLEETGLEPDRLALEITESGVMDDASEAARRLEELRALGIKLAVDDFGTGQSSLSYLKHFPIDYVKIDRSFVEDLGEGSEDEAIVSGLVDLAHALSLKAIAEGVETEVQLALLRELGCDVAQGDYFSEPLTSEAIRAWLDAHTK